MAIHTPPLYQQTGTYSAEEDRLGAASLLSGGVSTTLLRSGGGILPGIGGNMAVTQNSTPNMSVNVASGSCAVPGTSATTQGSYVCFNDNPVNLAISASDPANPRIDLIVVQVEDSGYIGTNNDVKLAVITGTAASSPTAPSVPASSVVLAQVTVPASASTIVTANIVAANNYVTANGGIVPVTSTTRPSNPYQGMAIYEIDTKLIQVYTSSGWGAVAPGTSSLPLGLIAQYQLPSASIASGTTTDYSCTFNAVAGRNYKFECIIEISYGSSGASSVNPIVMVLSPDGDYHDGTTNRYGEIFNKIMANNEYAQINGNIIYKAITTRSAIAQVSIANDAANTAGFVNFNAPNGVIMVTDVGSNV